MLSSHMKITLQFRGAGEMQNFQPQAIVIAEKTLHKNQKPGFQTFALYMVGENTRGCFVNEAINAKYCYYKASCGTTEETH